MFGALALNIPPDHPPHLDGLPAPAGGFRFSRMARPRRPRAL